MATQIEGFRLSPQQRRLWLLQEDSPAYRTQCALLFEGSLDVEKLKTVVNRIVNRHEALRTTFHQPPGLRVRLQVVAESSAPSWRFVDVSNLTVDQQQARFEELFRDEGRRHYDLEQDSTLHCSLVSQSSDRHILLLSLSALCADAWTLRNLSDEIVEAYASPGGEEDDEEAMPYAQVAEWQNGLLEDADGEAGRQYWRQRIAAANTTLTLPFEHESPAKTRFEPEVFAFSIDPHLVDKLDGVVAQHDVSLADFLLACWQTLLWRLTGSPEIVVGRSSHCRKYDELRGAFGLLAKTVPIWTQLNGRLSFNELLRHVCETTRKAETWQEYFSWEDSGAAADADRQPRFFPLCFDFEVWPESRRAGDISVSFFKRYECIDRFKIRLSCIRANRSLSAELHYDPACFQIEHLKPIARNFARLLESVVENPAAMIEELEIVSEVDRHQLLVDFNRTDSIDAEDRCLHELFEAQVRRTPDAVAVVSNAQRVSFAALNSRANQLAHFLRRRGIAADTPVGICLERSTDLIVAIIAVLKAGGAYLPIDPEQPAQRAARQLEEAQTPVLLTQRSLSERLSIYHGEIVALDDLAAAYRMEPANDPAPNARPHNLAYVIYTSGSTGIPKCIGVTHRGAVNYTRAASERLGLGGEGGAEDLHLATVSTVAADLGNTMIFTSLAGGGCLHVIGREETLGADEFAGCLRREPVDMLKIVPSHLRALLRASGEQFVLPQELVLGGERLNWELAEELLDTGVGVTNHYGPAETTVGSLTFRVCRERLPLSATVPIGRPLANTRIYVCDEQMRPVPAGVAGELHIGGEGLARGYLNRAELTAERFVPDPFSGELGGRLYRTGDVTRWLPSGEVEFLGRVDHQVKVRGFRVEPGEIEGVLEQHVAVREALVVVREDTPGDRRLVAYVVAAAGQSPGSSELYQFVKQQLPEYMVPAAFVVLESLPLTGNGKVDRSRLPVPEQKRPELGAAYEGPRTALEEALCGIWAEVLGVERVGIGDNFFELGGDSILSLQVIARARRVGLPLTPKQLFEHPSVGALAALAEGVGASSEAVGLALAEQGAVSGAVPLTPIQRWFFGRELRQPGHWNMAVLFEVAAVAEPALLQSALEQVVAHHDALRLRFERDAGGWRQYYAEAEVAVPFAVFDYTAMSEAEQLKALEAAATELQQGLDLARGPLVRGAHFRLGEKRGVRLLVVIHHLVVDAVSWRILVEDLGVVYEQLRQGQAVRLGPKTSSYKRWAETLVAYAASEAVAGEAAYWEAEVQRGAAGGPLPVDHEGGVNNAGSARGVTVRLGAEETRRLLGAVGRGARVQEVLLTALGRVLCGWSGAAGVLVEVEGHGREEVGAGVDVTRTVGWFTTIYPLWLECGGERSEAEALAAVRERVRGVPGGGLGYGVLKYLGGRELASAGAGVSFNYLGRFDTGGERRDGNGTAPLLRSANEFIGDNSNPEGNRAHLLKIIGFISGGQLQVTWTYSENLHRRETIERLATQYMEAVQSLLDHCQSPQANSFTPSDFPNANLSQEALDQFISRLGQANRRQPQ